MLLCLRGRKTTLRLTRRVLEMLDIVLQDPESEEHNYDDVVEHDYVYQVHIYLS